MRRGNLLTVCLITGFLWVEAAFAGIGHFSPRLDSRSIARDGLLIAGGNGLMASLNNPASLISLTGAGMEISLIDGFGQHVADHDRLGYFQSFRENDWCGGGGFYWSPSGRWTFALSAARILDYRVNWPYALLYTGETSSVIAFDVMNQLNGDLIAPALAVRQGRFILGAAACVYRVSHKSFFAQSNTLWSENLGLAGYTVE